MTEQEIAEIEKVGPTHPRYEEYLKWKAANSAATSGLNSPKDKTEDKGFMQKVGEGIQNFKDKYVATPEELHDMTKDRADVKSRGDMSMRANPSVDAIDVLQNDATGLKGSDNAVQFSDTEGGELKDGSKFQLGDKSDAQEASDVTSSVTSVTQPENGDSPKVKAAKNKYNKTTMSIWDAYYAGEFGEPGSAEAKRTAGYFTIDAIAKLASNLGRRVGNVGAQYSGGTIDEGHDVSDWEQRKESMLSEEVSKESQEISTFENELKRYQLDKSKTVNDMLNDFNTKANDPSLSAAERKVYQNLAVQLAGANIDRNAQLINVGSGLLDMLKEGIKDW